jgi:ubiquinone/menaquinone biosynthesis C-methylase UbiE
MNQHHDPVREFFNQPFYLERGRYVIEVREIVLRELLGEVNNKRILDLGCGDGSLSIQFLNTSNELTMVDISPRMIEIARARIPDQMRDRVRLINAPIDQFQAIDQYDIVICVGVLAHVPSIGEAIKKIEQCLKPGGTAVIEFTANPNPIGKFLLPYYWLRRFFTGNLQGYKQNQMPLMQLVRIFLSHGLSLKKDRRHLFPVPTMRWWPNKWFRRYVRFTSDSPIFLRIGTEHIMLFTKILPVVSAPISKPFSENA